MKKSLVALAVLAASGASFAQSSVTVYGVLDIWGGTMKTENGVTGASLTNTVLESGGVSHDRFGFKGSEDLGGGLKANFNLEQGFTLDNGAHDTGSTGFNRYAWVGLSGGFGEIKLGKTATAFDDVNGASDAVFDSALSPMNHVFGSTAYNWTPPNTIMYVTPSMGGFGAELSYSLGEDKASAATAPTLTAKGRTASGTSITSLNLTYGAGPLALQFGYQVEGTNVIFVGGAQGSDAKFTRLGGTYDFGVAKLYANYGKVTNVANVSGADTTDYQIGADFPVSAALTLSASYAKSDDNSTAGDQSRKGYGIAANYTLSKRTSIYGGYNANTFTNAGAADSKLDILALGIRHAF